MIDCASVELVVLELVVVAGSELELVVVVVVVAAVGECDRCRSSAVLVALAPSELVVSIPPSAALHAEPSAAITSAPPSAVDDMEIDRFIFSPHLERHFRASRIFSRRKHYAAAAEMTLWQVRRGMSIAL